MLRNTWRFVRQTVSSSERWNWAIFVSLLIGLGILALFGSMRDRDIAFNERSWKTMQSCEHAMRPTSIGVDQFRIYVSAAFIGQELCKRLSGIPELASRYRSIRAEWELSGEQLAQRIFEHDLELLQLRPEQAQETGGPLTEDYRRISYYPAYSAALIARDNLPELTEAYLQSRSIGLRLDTKSRSGYRVPMRAFRDAGLDLQQLEQRVKRYPSHAELRRALERGEVDVIGSYWEDREQAEHPTWQALKIDRITEGLNWFLANEVFTTKKDRCAVISILHGLTDLSRDDPYFSELKIIPEAAEGCDDR